MVFYFNLRFCLYPSQAYCNRCVWELGSLNPDELDILLEENNHPVGLNMISEDNLIKTKLKKQSIFNMRSHLKLNILEIHMKKKV